MAPTLETHWYYLGADGKVVTGPQVIDGVRVYFNYRGHQAKGDFGYDGYYYDKDTGALVKNSFVSLEQPSGTLIYYLDNEGNTIKNKLLMVSISTSVNTVSKLREISHLMDFFMMQLQGNLLLIVMFKSMTRVTHIIPLKIKINGSISVQTLKLLKESKSLMA